MVSLFFILQYFLYLCIKKTVMLDLEKYRQKLILENYDFLESKVDWIFKHCNIKFLDSFIGDEMDKLSLVQFSEITRIKYSEVSNVLKGKVKFKDSQQFMWSCCILFHFDEIVGILNTKYVLMDKSFDRELFEKNFEQSLSGYVGFAKDLKRVGELEQYIEEFKRLSYLIKDDTK